MKRPCASPGCRVLLEQGVRHCARHAIEAERANLARIERTDRKRRQTNWRGWYKLARWRRRRADLLAREPLCRRCAEMGKTVPASVADHVHPHRGDPDLFWGGPLQPLCHGCHSAAKQREERSR